MRPHFSALLFLPVEGSFAIAQVKIIREDPQHPRKYVVATISMSRALIFGYLNSCGANSVR
jgi:hypothetical protein